MVSWNKKICLISTSNQYWHVFFSELIGDNFTPVTPGNYHVLDTWIGSKRRPECIKTGSANIPGYETDLSSSCSRVRVFEWLHGVAPNPPNFEADWDHIREPNFLFRREECQSVMKRSKEEATLNDIACSRSFNFFVEEKHQSSWVLPKLVSKLADF